MRRRVRITNRPGSRTTRVVAVSLTATLTIAALGACSSDNGGNGGSNAGGDEEITLRVGVFGQFGFEEAGLYDRYEELHPNISIEQDSITDSGDYMTQLRTRLSQESGLLDIQAIEVGNIAEMATELPDRWVDFNEYDTVDPSHFAPWKNAQATSPDGRLIGLGTDIGPTGICYRTDYFEQAGLPTERDEVSALFADGWEAYLTAGAQFQTQGPADVAFLDSAGGMFNAVVSAYEERYYNAAGDITYQDTESVQTAWALATEAAASGLSSGLEQFQDDWNRAMANGDFATLPSCPAWMLGYIQTQAGEAGQDVWDVAQSPAPSNWGGSFIGVPQAAEHPEEAVALAAWLTAPEQLATLFTERGSFPSSIEAQQLPAVLDATHPYFNDAPIGEIFSQAAADIPSTRIGPYDQQIQDGITDGLLALEQNDLSPDAAWDDVVSALDNAVGE